MLTSCSSSENFVLASESILVMFAFSFISSLMSSGDKKIKKKKEISFLSRVLLGRGTQGHKRGDQYCEPKFTAVKCKNSVKSQLNTRLFTLRPQRSCVLCESEFTT